MIDRKDERGVRVLTLSRPPANMLDLASLRALAAAAREAGADPGVRAVVLRSALPKYFSAGLEASELLGPDGRPRAEPFEALGEAFRAWLGCPKPTIAAIGGSARLGGCVLALAFDFRFLAAETGRVSLSEVRLGLSPTPAVLARLAALGVTGVGVRQLVLKGRALRADEALAAGLADRVVPAKALDEEAKGEARALAKLPPGAYAAVKRHLSRAAAPDGGGLWEESLTEFGRLLASDEAREALGKAAARG